MNRFWTFAYALLLGASVAVAQNAATAEQMQIFQGLTPEQQSAVLERMSGTGRSGATDNNSTSGRSGARGTENQQDRFAVRNEPDEPLIPVLKPDDTIIVEMSLPPDFPGLRTDENPQLTTPVQPLPGMPNVRANQSNGQPPESDSILRRNRTNEPLDAKERERLELLVALVLSRNPYTLDRNAQLNLPGFAPISLSGLTEEQATQRLAVEPVLLKLDVRIVRLPLVKTGVAGLKPFGYDLFDEIPSTFSPVTDVPVPADYVMGAGDEINVQLFGSQNRTLALVVNRDGSVTFPELGPIRIAGQRFSQAKASIESRVAEQMIGVRANVSMGDMRSIRVFVMGEARLPGSYTVSGLASITSALFASGGVKPIGSLRNIQLKRQGTVVRTLDLYDMLIRGDTSADAKLQPGDVIFIPPVGPTVSIDGEVRRPAIYELRGDTDVSGLLQMAGGLSPEADARRTSVTRVDEQYRRVVLDIDLSTPAGGSRVLRNGDVLRVTRLRPQIDSGVTLDGFVHRPGPVAWREGLRLSDVIGSIDELKANADARYILVRRESGNERQIQVLSADLVAALSARGGPRDIALMPRDQITVFDLAPGRERIIKPLLDELRLQSGIAQPTQLVRVEGSVKVPGEYPLEPGMTVSDLLRAGGNLEAAAFGGKAELARYEVDAEGSRQTELIEIDLASVLSGNRESDVVLKPFDYLLIKEIPNWADQESVTLVGEVVYPGTYPIRRGETLAQLLNRAGGLSPLAFAKGSAFTREELKEREQKQLDLLADRMQSDLASLALQAAAANQAGASQAITAGQSLLGQLRQFKAVGRLIIDLPGLLEAQPGSAKDVILRNGDTLVVPTQKQEVTVIGEVQSVASHLFNRSYSRDEYIALSGGMTQKADTDRIYVVRADGSTVAEQSSLLRRSRVPPIQSGDTIIVPLDTERIPRLPFWQAVTQIVYNLAVSVAAINSF
jgi:polysaccharide biosynthesis/export protein